MKNSFRLLCGTVALGAITGCHDYLTGGELSNDPNRPVVASNGNLLVGIETNVWGFVGGDPARTTGIFAQQFTGAGSQYQANIQTYQITEDNTNGSYAGVYGGGGLVDIRNLEQGAAAAKDTVFLGVAQVYEGMLMGTAADLFGDVVYSEALQGTPNPKLDDQLAVYDSVQKVLSAAIVNLGKTELPAARRGGHRVWWGPGRVHRAGAYAEGALLHAHGGGPADGICAGARRGEAGNLEQRGQILRGRGSTPRRASRTSTISSRSRRGDSGYVVPNAGFVALLDARNDPRRAEYFNAKGDGPECHANGCRISSSRTCTYDENTLIWAEAAYRTGDQATALAKLNEERANNGLPAEAVSGQALLREILTEEYIADFQLGFEAFNDLQSHVLSEPRADRTGKIPGRLYYDASERQTDTSIPQPGTAPNTLKNPDNPPNATSDGTGAGLHRAVSINEPGHANEPGDASPGSLACPGSRAQECCRERRARDQPSPTRRRRSSGPRCSPR